MKDEFIHFYGSHEELLEQHGISTKSIQNILKNKFTFLTPNQIDFIKDETVDLSINTASFAEMTKKDIEIYFDDVDEIIYKHYFSNEGGFSYFQNKSQLYYYGLNITNGLNKPDIHGSTLLLWALSLITDYRKNSDININILKP